MKPSRLYIYNAFSCLLPPSKFFKLKVKMLRWAGASVGDNVRIVSGAKFLMTGDLYIGDNVWIGHNFLLIGGDAKVVIGSEVDIGPGVTFVTGSHELDLGGSRAAGRGISLPINIGNGVWIGANVTILGGVSVGDVSFLAAGAVVVKNVQARMAYAGVPAKEMKNIF